MKPGPSETKDQDVTHDAAHFESQFCHICQYVTPAIPCRSHSTEPLPVDACLRVAGDMRTFDKQMCYRQSRLGSITLLEENEEPMDTEAVVGPSVVCFWGMI